MLFRSALKSGGSFGQFALECRLLHRGGIDRGPTVTRRLLLSALQRDRPVGHLCAERRKRGFALLQLRRSLGTLRFGVFLRLGEPGGRTRQLRRVPLRGALKIGVSLAQFGLERRLLRHGGLDRGLMITRRLLLGALERGRRIRKLCAQRGEFGRLALLRSAAASPRPPRVALRRLSPPR